MRKEEREGGDEAGSAEGSGRAFPPEASLGSAAEGPRATRAVGSGGLLEALGVLLATANPAPFPAPRPTLRRALLFCWNVVAILLVTAYNSGLLAHLTAPHFPPPVDTLQEFVDAGFYWGTFIAIPPLDHYFDHETLLAASLRLTIYKDMEQVATFARTSVEAVFNAYDDIQCFAVFTRTNSDDTLLFLKYISQQIHFSFVMESGGRRGDCPGLMMIGKSWKSIVAIWHIRRLETLLTSSVDDRTQTLTKKYIPLLAVVHNDAYAETRELPSFFMRSSALGMEAIMRVVEVAGPAPFRAFWGDQTSARFVPLDRRLATAQRGQAAVRQRWPDIRGGEFRMAVTHLPPFMFNDGDGVEMKIVKTLADVLNGNVSFVPIEEGKNFWQDSIFMTSARRTNVTGGVALNLNVSRQLDFGNPTHQAVKARFKKEKSPRDLGERLARGDYAQLGNYISGAFCPLGLPPPPAALPRLRLVRESVRCDANALAFPHYSLLRPWADRVVLLLAQRSALGVVAHKRVVVVAGPAPFRAFWADRAAGRYVRLDRRLAETHPDPDDFNQRWPNIHGEELRMTVTHYPPFMFNNGSGVEMKIVETLANVLNGKVSFEPLEDHKYFWHVSLQLTRRSRTNVTGGYPLNLAVSQHKLIICFIIRERKEMFEIKIKIL
ncbi:Glutamate receptor 3.1 [Gryllus bimaculatus]|nr:Glutamate receptor 3.1 [Gryllus bimaculatus]